jgi:hypothetical protein
VRKRLWLVALAMVATGIVGLLLVKQQKWTGFSFLLKAKRVETTGFYSNAEPHLPVVEQDFMIEESFEGALKLAKRDLLRHGFDPVMRNPGHHIYGRGPVMLMTVSILFIEGDEFIEFSQESPSSTRVHVKVLKNAPESPTLKEEPGPLKRFFAWLGFG